MPDRVDDVLDGCRHRGFAGGRSDDRSGWCGNGQIQHEQGAAFGGLAGRHGAPEQGREVPHDRQTKAGAGVATRRLALELLESIEDGLSLIRRDPRAAVADLELTRVDRPRAASRARGRRPA